MQLLECREPAGPLTIFAIGLNVSSTSCRSRIRARSAGRKITAVLSQFSAKENYCALPWVVRVKAVRLLDWFPLISLTAPRGNPPPSS